LIVLSLLLVVRFRNLRSLNLADNDLRVFPLSLCSIATLAHLNLASNKLEEIPGDICTLTKLVTVYVVSCMCLDLRPQLREQKWYRTDPSRETRFCAAPMNAVVCHFCDKIRHLF
jgi:Leucine-rich repeat (LRR) protein